MNDAGQRFRWVFSGNHSNHCSNSQKHHLFLFLEILGLLSSGVVVYAYIWFWMITIVQHCKCQLNQLFFTDTESITFKLYFKGLIPFY